MWASVYLDGVLQSASNIPLHLYQIDGTRRCKVLPLHTHTHTQPIPDVRDRAPHSYLDHIGPHIHSTWCFLNHTRSMPIIHTHLHLQCFFSVWLIDNTHICTQRHKQSFVTPEDVHLLLYGQREYDMRLIVSRHHIWRRTSDRDHSLVETRVSLKKKVSCVLFFLCPWAPHSHINVHMSTCTYSPTHDFSHFPAEFHPHVSSTVPQIQSSRCLYSYMKLAWDQQKRFRNWSCLMSL